MFAALFRLSLEMEKSIARDFKEFIRISAMAHVRTSLYYPQSNGKIERWHKSLKGECIRPGKPLMKEDARRLIDQYVGHYNTRAPAQCQWLCHAGGPVGGPLGTDPQHA
jgi:hypothetical protein